MIGPCSQCDCVLGVWNGRREWLLCANFPGHEGQLSHVSGTGIVVDCRKFRPRCDLPAMLPEGEAVRYIPLGGGQVAIVDAADFAWLNRYKWRAFGKSGGFYAVCRIGQKMVFMHRLIKNPPPGKVVDHANGNRQDNRRCNLRNCTAGENARNNRKGRGASRFKGVSYNRRLGKWGARICREGRTRHLGWFDNEIDAAEAYDRAARKYFGEFARLNFPEVVSGRRQVIESQSRTVKPETTPNPQKRKPRTASAVVRPFSSLSPLDFGHCFGLRVSCLELPRLRPRGRGPPRVRNIALKTPARAHEQPAGVTSSYVG
jgi:hypothetical protein